MPRIETFQLSPSAVPEPQQGVRQDPVAAAGGAAAVARGAKELMGTVEHFEMRYANARREADLATLQAESMKRLGEAQLRWSKVPDADAARQGFDAEAAKIKTEIGGRIQDPYVQMKFNPHFDERATTSSFSTRSAAFGLESSKRKGELLTNLNTYAHAMARADNPLDRQQILDTADEAIGAYERGGWLDPEAASKLRLTTRSKADEVQARQIINDSPEAAMKLLGDAKNFPSLDEKTREVLERQAISRTDTLVRQRVAQAEKNERETERKLKIDQGIKEIEVFGRLDSTNPPSLEDIETLGRTRQISPDGYLSARRAILAGERGRDDADYVNSLHARILAGEASLAEIRDAPLSSISMKTKSTMMDKWKSVQEGGAYASRDYRDGLDTLKAAIVTTGPGSQFVRSDEQIKLARARRELDEWIRANKVGVDDTARVWQKVDEMMPRYQSAPPSAYGLPRPRLGEVKTGDDVAKVAEATAAALASGKISEADALAEDQLLGEYRTILRRQEDLAAARRKAQENGGRGGRTTQQNTRGAGNE